MATGTRLMQEISDQFLNCKICFENFRDPKTLTCLHTFCCHCLQQQYESEVTSRTSRYNIYSRTVTCPLCRQKTELPSGGVRRLPDNFLVSNLREVLAKRNVSKVPPCEICHSVRTKNVDACSKCLDCSKLLCKACVEQHVTTKVTQQHSLIDLEGEKNIECKEHPDENVRFYCEPCDTCICVVCTFQEHKDHEVCSFTDGFAKHKLYLEGLLTKCKERLNAMNTRLQHISKHEKVVKDVKEKIRDLAISYIAQVRAKERELMKKMEEEFGETTQEFLESKPVIQEAVEELQTACNLTDIMLKDKGVEMLLLKKELESKMNHYLESSLPEIPDNFNFDIRFVPGETFLGRLLFGKDKLDDADRIKGKSNLIPYNGINDKLENGGDIDIKTRSADPDVLSNCTQTERCRTCEISTSMYADMTIGYSHGDSQTDLTRDAIEELYVAARKVANDSKTKPKASIDHGKVLVKEKKKSGKTPPPDLLPKSSLDYTPGRWIMTRKVQTDISSTDFQACRNMSDREYIHSLLLSQQLPKPKYGPETENVMHARDPKCRRTSDAETMTTQEMKSPRFLTEVANVSTNRGRRNISVHAVCDSCTIETQTPTVSFSDAITCTDRDNQMEKWTSTPSIALIDRDTSMPHVTFESKTTWTDLLSTSDRATCTISTKLQDRGIGTLIIKTCDAAFQANPYTQNIATNTPSIDTIDGESQVVIEVTEQGTIPDPVIEEAYTKYRTAHEDSSVDSPPKPKPSPTIPTQKCDRACDAFKPMNASKATETLKTKTVSSATETFNPKFVDKDTATHLVTTIDQWTETLSPQLVSTGVTPPRPATLEVGVATIFIQTNDQASCTDVTTYRSSHTETTMTVCDNETITESIGQADAQTSVQIMTENAETETDPTSCYDQASNTDLVDSPEVVRRQSTSKTVKNVQTDFSYIHCSICHHFDSTERQNCNKTEAIIVGEALPPSPNQETQNQFKEFKDNATMAISCATCQRDLQEVAIQTSTPLQIDQALETSFDFEQDFLVRALSREYQDAATSTESLPYIGLLSEIDVDELIVVPEAAFELVSDSDSDYQDVPMVDSETCTDFLQLVEAGTQTLPGGSYTETDCGNEVGSQGSSKEPILESSTSSNGKGIGEIIRSMVLSEGERSMLWDEHDKDKGTKQVHTPITIESSSKHLVSIGVNTIPKVTFEKETCTPIRHLFSKGTMTFYVSKMDKSTTTSTLAPSRLLGDLRLGNRGMVKAKSHDKITMTSKAEQKDVGVETECGEINGRIEQCISKLRNVSERLNSPTGRKVVDGESFFGSNVSSTSESKSETEEQRICLPGMIETHTASPKDTTKSEEERQKNVNDLLQQTGKSPIIRKPQPITTLKGRKPVSVKEAEGTVPSRSNLAVPEKYDEEDGSKSLPRQFSTDRPRPVRMGSQPLTPSRLPLLRYNSAPGRIATVPSHTLMMKTQNSIQQSAKATGATSPRTSPSKIPISKKLSPPDKLGYFPMSPPMERKIPESQPIRPHLRRPLPSITETRTPSTCSDTSMTSYMSSSSAAESAPIPPPNSLESSKSKRLSADSSSMIEASGQTSNSIPSCMSTSLVEESKTKPKSRPISTATSSSLVTLNSESLSDSVFKKSSSDTLNSVASTETLDDKTSPPSSTSKKSGLGFMQRLLSKRKKVIEPKKGKSAVLKSGPSIADAATALASAAPVPQAPVPESQAHGAQLQLPPHHYPPQPQPKASPTLQKPRPFVYVRQRLLPIQQDNVEEVNEKNDNPVEGQKKSNEPLPQSQSSKSQQQQQQQQHQTQPPSTSTKTGAAGKEKVAKEKQKEKNKSKTIETVAPVTEKERGKSKAKSTPAPKKRDERKGAKK